MRCDGAQVVRDRTESVGFFPGMDEPYVKVRELINAMPQQQSQQQALIHVRATVPTGIHPSG